MSASGCDGCQAADEAILPDSGILHKEGLLLIAVSSVMSRVCHREARLYIVSNGQGSPCLDLRRVPASLADATVGTDLVILEGAPPPVGSQS